MKPIFLLLSFVGGSALAAASGAHAAAVSINEPITLYLPPESASATIAALPRRTTPEGQTKLVLTNTFAEEFERMPALVDADGQSGRWAPHLDGGWNATEHHHMGYTWAIKRRQPSASEQQIYVDANYGNKDVNPFSVNGGVLAIKAERTKAGSYNALKGFGITSGLLSTHQLYGQKYGYFEMRAKVPAGPALLPAFWMLAVDRTPGEIDIMEAPGHLLGQISQGIHWNGNHSGMPTAVPDFHKAMHTYGALWLADRIVFYIDRVAVSQIATRAEQKKPYYMMVNLALGGEWMQKWVEPGDAIFPVTMEVDSIAAYTPQNAPCIKGKDNRGVEICE